jgi:sensor histidine kinase regulating citrate/malate metabolism
MESKHTQSLEQLNDPKLFEMYMDVKSPKMCQEQTEAKIDVESSIISSFSSIISDNEDGKISIIRTEKQINKLSFNKEAVVNY